MNNKDKKIVGYNENGFPIYEGDNNQVSSPTTFIDYKNVKYKFGFLTKVSILFLGLSIFILVGGTIWCFSAAQSSADSGNDAYGWALLFLWIISINLIILYSVLTAVGISSDRENAALNKKSSKLNIIVRTIFLLSPFLLVGKSYLSYYIENNTKHNIRIGDIKMTIPAGFGKSSYTLSSYGKSKYSALGYSNYDCFIALEYHDNEYSDFIDSFIKYARREVNIDESDKLEVESGLKEKNINGKKWVYYEHAGKSYSYQNYGLIINGDFYTLLLRDNANNTCDKYFEKVFNSIKYLD